MTKETKNAILLAVNMLGTVLRDENIMMIGGKNSLCFMDRGAPIAEAYKTGFVVKIDQFYEAGGADGD